MNEILSLNLSETEKILFETDVLEKDLLFCDEIYVNFDDQNELYRLAYDCLQYNLHSLEGLLTKAIKKELKLPVSIDNNIGYLWNIYLDDREGEGFEYFLLEGRKKWIGTRYILWESSSSNLTTWIYNDRSENIVLEVTPDYRWHFMDPEPGDEFITFEEFMKNYKPLFRKVVPYSVAKEWLVKTQKLLKKIEPSDDGR